MTHQTETLRSKIEKEITTWELDANPKKNVVDAILSAFLSEWERVKPKESHISYHNEDDVRYLHEEGGKELVLWEEGYNKALSAADTAIKEILK